MNWQGHLLDGCNSTCNSGRPVVWYVLVGLLLGSGCRAEKLLLHLACKILAILVTHWNWKKVRDLV
jgi:hypothetical protein